MSNLCNRNFSFLRSSLKVTLPFKIKGYYSHHILTRSRLLICIQLCSTSLLAMNPLNLSRATLSSNMASMYDVLATICSFFYASGHLLSFIADEPIEDLKSILDTAAEKHSAGYIIA